MQHTVWEQQIFSVHQRYQRNFQHATRDIQRFLESLRQNQKVQGVELDLIQFIPRSLTLNMLYNKEPTHLSSLKNTEVQGVET